MASFLERKGVRDILIKLNGPRWPRRANRPSPTTPSSIPAVTFTRHLLHPATILPAAPTASHNPRPALRLCPRSATFRSHQQSNSLGEKHAGKPSVADALNPLSPIPHPVRHSF